MQEKSNERGEKRDATSNIAHHEEITKLFNTVWPKVVARVWKDDFESDWCKQLLSGNPKVVADALRSVGLNLNEDFLEKIKIVVKRSEDGIALSSISKKSNDPQYTEIVKAAKNDQKIRSDLPKYQNGWKSVEGLNQCLVLTIPPKPSDPEESASAIVDYINRFSFLCC